MPKVAVCSDKLQKCKHMTKLCSDVDGPYVEAGEQDFRASPDHLNRVSKHLPENRGSAAYSPDLRLVRRRGETLSEPGPPSPDFGTVPRTSEE